MRLRVLSAGLCLVHLAYGQECPADMVLARPGVCVDRYEYSSMPTDIGLGKPFLAASGIPEPGFIDGVIWDATTSCRLSGKRTCNLREWVAACKGVGGTKYPYGDRYDASACNTNKQWRYFDFKRVSSRNYDELERLDQSAPVGSFPRCVSAAGAYDMVGNAEEWVRCDSGKFGWCLVGGYWAHPQTCTEAIVVHAPNWHLYETSFRCCMDVEIT